jgi:hypothetical protein
MDKVNPWKPLRIRRSHLLRLILLLAALIILGSWSVASEAQEAKPQDAPEAYIIGWWTVDGGGVSFDTAGDFTLGGSIAQTDAVRLYSGDFTLEGGFWSATVPGFNLMLPIVKKAP